jgi:hypothetical protein
VVTTSSGLQSKIQQHVDWTAPSSWKETSATPARPTGPLAAWTSSSTRPPTTADAATDLHQYDCSTNSASTLLMRSILDNEVGQIVYASSGCIYPLYIQTDRIFYLTEDKAGPPMTRTACTAWRSWPAS